MSASTTLDEARELTRRALASEARRSGCREVARDRVAGRIGCAPGTLENVGKGRLKRIEHWFLSRLRALVAREIEQEIQALTHELHLLRASGVEPHSMALGEVEAHLAAARLIMEEMK